MCYEVSARNFARLSWTSSGSTTHFSHGSRAVSEHGSRVKGSLRAWLTGQGQSQGMAHGSGAVSGHGARLFQQRVRSTYGDEKISLTRISYIFEAPRAPANCGHVAAQERSHGRCLCALARDSEAQHGRLQPGESLDAAFVYLRGIQTLNMNESLHPGYHHGRSLRASARNPVFQHERLHFRLQITDAAFVHLRGIRELRMGYGRQITNEASVHLRGIHTLCEAGYKQSRTRSLRACAEFTRSTYPVANKRPSRTRPSCTCAVHKLDMQGCNQADHHGGGHT